MSNGIRDFFQKYNAVPANDAGPQWDTASDDALIGWLNSELSLLRRADGDPRRTILKAVLVEAWKRVAKIGRDCPSQPNDWPERHTLGRILAALAMNADLLNVSIK